MVPARIARVHIISGECETFTDLAMASRVCGISQYKLSSFDGALVEDGWVYSRSVRQYKSSRGGKEFRAPSPNKR